jgi:sorbitol-specific phosphotransferase system component IIBC
MELQDQQRRPNQEQKKPKKMTISDENEKKVGGSERQMEETGSEPGKIFGLFFDARRKCHNSKISVGIPRFNKT